ncbi:MAG: DMT family transporter [Alphaproteobacteria bacterium]|nr:DMT family transporter [Alphaproteobacteria bacterium]
MWRLLSEIKSRDNLWLAIVFASINAFMLAGMSLFSKLLSQYYGPLEIAFLRKIFSLVVLVLWIGATRQMFLVHTHRPLAHLFRAGVGTLGIVLGMWALSMMPITETTILLFTSPLFTVLLSFFVLKERVGIYRFSAVALGFIGVLIVASPGVDGIHITTLGIAVGLGWGLCSGVVDICLRGMGVTERPTTTTFYFVLFGSLVLALHLPFAEVRPGGFSLSAMGIMAGLGFCGLFSLLAKSQSFRLGEAALVSPMMYTMLVWSILFDYLFWDRMPRANALLGGAIIIGSNLFILYREMKIKKLIRKRIRLARFRKRKLDGRL